MISFTGVFSSDNDELAPETLLGYTAMRVPVDLQYARLILFGVMFGCPCDAVVMAAAMQVSLLA